MRHTTSRSPGQSGLLISVLFVKQRKLNGALFHQFSYCRSCTDPVQTFTASEIAANAGLDEHFPVLDNHDALRLEAVTEFLNLLDTVAESALFPSKTSTAIGCPSMSQSRPVSIWNLPRLPSLEYPRLANGQCRPSYQREGHREQRNRFSDGGRPAFFQWHFDASRASPALHRCPSALNPRPGR